MLIVWSISCWCVVACVHSFGNVAFAIVVSMVLAVLMSQSGIVANMVIRDSDITIVILLRRCG